MGILINSNTKAPNTLKLASSIATFLFEQECGECRNYMKESEITQLKKVQRMLVRVANRAK